MGVLRRQLRGGWRGLRSRSRRPPHSRLLSRCDGHAERAARAAGKSRRRRHFHLRIWGRLQLFQAGLIAGCVQAAIVVLITPLALLLAHYGDNDLSASDRNSGSPVISLLPLIYVVFAAGVALTKHRYLALTTTRIRHASRLMSASEPERAAGTICHLSLVCINRMRIISLATASGQPGCYELASRRVRSSAYNLVGNHKCRCGQLWSKLACRRRRG